MNWGGIEELEDALGKIGVCSNYAPELATYTWTCLDNFTGGRALFTQPSTPIKCAGAPQKIAYLAAHHLQKRNLRGDGTVDFYNGRSEEHTSELQSRGHLVC